MTAGSTSLHLDQERWEHQASVGDFPRFIVFVACLGALVAILAWLTGPPHLPETLPSTADISRVLTTSELPNDAVVYLGSSLAWLTLGYLAVATLLRTLACVFLRRRGATRVARQLLRLTDLLTIPFVRRLTDSTVAGLLLTSAWLPSLPRTKTTGHAAVALVAPIPHRVAPVPAMQLTSGVALDGIPALLLAAPVRAAIPYTVVAGDTLWNIADRFYGDGERYPEIIAANEGKAMSGGEVFGDPDLIREGWVLEIPLPAANVVSDDRTLTYRVQAGDSLLTVAARFLGDSLRWIEIWEINKGRDMGGGRSFTNPDLVFPGWTLRLPTAPVALELPAQPGRDETPAPPVAEATPLPSVPVSPEPEPATDVTDPVIADSGAIDDQRGEGSDWSPQPLVIAASAAGLAAAGAAAVLARRALRSRSAGSGGRRPSSGRRHSHRSRKMEGDVEWVQLATSLLLTALAEQGFAAVRLIACREARDAISFVLACPPGEAQATIDARFALARRLSCAVEAFRLDGDRVELTISHLRREATALFSDLDGESPARLLVPVGATDDELHYVNLAAAGNVWLAGTEVATSGLLRSWLATLAASCSPRTYEVVCDEGEPWVLGAERVALGTRRQPAMSQSDGGILEALETGLAARAAGGIADEGAPILLALLNTQIVDESGRLETLLRRGPSVGIVTILSNINGEPVDPALQRACGASVVFADAPLAEDLATGSLLFTLSGETPVTLRPVLVSPPFDDRDAARNVFEQSAESDTPPRHEQRVSPIQLRLTEVTQIDEESPPANEGRTASVGQKAVMRSTDAASDVAELVTPSGSDSGDAVMLATLQPVCAGIHDPPAPVEQPVSGDGAPAGERSDLPPPFRVRCFGAFQVELDGRPVTNWKVQKARELLAYLIVKGGAPVPREETWEALWPDQDIGQMQRLLSDTAYHLRRALKEMSGGMIEPLVTQGQRYHLNTEIFRVDLAAYEAHLSRATTLSPADALVEYDRALALFRGGLFGAEPFEWAEPYRREHEATFLKAAHTAAKLASESGNGQQALSFYRAILAYDPIDEEAARGLMQCYANLGDINGVRKAYKTLVESLRRELDDPDALPLPETTKVWQQLLARTSHKGS